MVTLVTSEEVVIESGSAKLASEKHHLYSLLGGLPLSGRVHKDEVLAELREHSRRASEGSSVTHCAFYSPADGQTSVCCFHFANKALQSIAESSLLQNPSETLRSSTYVVCGQLVIVVGCS